MPKYLHYWLLDSAVLIKISYRVYLKYIFRFLFNWKTNYAWVSYLNSTPQVTRWKEDGYGILHLKLQYSYLTVSFDYAERLLCLKQHYEWFFNQIDENYYLQQESLPLWQHVIDYEDSREHLDLYLQFRAEFKQEGEMALLLKLNGAIQYTLTFSYVLLNEQATFFIGGLQGGRQHLTNPESIKQLTKHLYGLRPKQLMLHALSVLCDFYNVQHIVGVSNVNHASQGRRKNCKELVKTNMDEFWLEFGAQQLSAQGDFLFKPLGCSIDLEKVPSKKRSQYRKRQLILDGLFEQGKSQLSSLRQPFVIE